MKKKLIIVMALLALAFGGTAQSSGKIWNLDECMQYAVENSPTAKKQEFRNNSYKQDYIQSIAGLAPSISGSTSTTWRFGRGTDPETNTYTNISTFSNPYSASASMPIFNGFANINNIRATKVARLRGTEESKKIADDISLSTMQAYFDVVYYTGAVELARQQLEESRHNLYKNERMEELGLQGRADVAQIEAQVAGDDYNLTRQENLLNAAILNLKDNMNYPFEEELKIDTQITAESGLIESDPMEIFAEARGRLPQALISDLQLRESELNLAYYRGLYLPSITAQGGYSTDFYKRLTGGGTYESFSKQLQNNSGEYAQLTLSIPIFGGLTRRTNVARAKNKMRIAEQENIETMRQLQSEIEQAVMDVQGFAKQYVQAVKKVIATEEAHKANQRKFDQGMISALELQTSANQLLLARAEQLEVRLQYLLKSRLLDFYKGIPLIRHEIDVPSVTIDQLAF